MDPWLRCGGPFRGAAQACTATEINLDFAQKGTEHFFWEWPVPPNPSYWVYTRTHTHTKKSFTDFPTKNVVYWSLYPHIVPFMDYLTWRIDLRGGGGVVKVPTLHYIPVMRKQNSWTGFSDMTFATAQWNFIFWPRSARLSGPLANRLFNY